MSTADQSSEWMQRSFTHEIRTLVSSVIAAADLLQFKLSDRQDLTELIEVLQKNAHGLIELTNNAMDLAILDEQDERAGQIEVDPGQLVVEVVRLRQQQAKAKGIFLKVNCETAIPSKFMSNPLRLRQLLLNLIDNAIKFTFQGGVTVMVGMADNRIYFSVVDTGIGIPVAQQAWVFEPFNQVDKNTSRVYRGAGIGLTICRRLAKCLGGDITLASEPDQGSTFTVTLPVCMDEPYALIGSLPQLTLSDSYQKKNDDLLPVLTDKRILIVDAQVASQLRLCVQLKSAGATVHVQQSVDSAADHLNKGPAYSCVLVAIRQTATLNKLPRLRKAVADVPIIGLGTKLIQVDRTYLDAVLSMQAEGRAIAAMIAKVIASEN